MTKLRSIIKNPTNILRLLKLALRKSLRLRRRIRIQYNYIQVLKEKVKDPTTHPELTNIIKNNILPTELVHLALLNKAYEKTILFTVPNTMTYYLVFLVFVREFLALILVHVYICLFILSCYFKNIMIYLTHCNYTGGHSESFIFAGILILILMSQLLTNDVGKAVFKGTAWLRAFIAASVFFRVCMGVPFTQCIFSNHIFTIAIHTQYTANTKIYPLPQTPDFNTLFPILIDIPTAHYI